MSKHITFVADELLGYAGNGLGTTTTFLALALARLGHRVDVLFLGRPPSAPIATEWARLYERFDVGVTPLAPRTERTQPSLFARTRDVELALRAGSPDVVVAQDLGAPAYAAQRMRRLGLGFQHTSFVVVCHGTRQWTADSNRKLRVLPGALAVSVTERASVELADVAVSPSAYMVEWMRAQGWHLPEQIRVIPHPSRSVATGEPSPTPAPASTGRIERIAFFGRLEERKGIGVFTAALNDVDTRLLQGVALNFIGRPTNPWPTRRVETELSERVKSSVSDISFETELDQHQALARLARPGTLAVMPSLEDNLPNTVYECLLHGIPFLTGDVGGAAELVAPADRERVLFDPTPEGIAHALRRALADPQEALRPAAPAFDEEESLRRWQEVLALPPRAHPPAGRSPRVEVVVFHRSSQAALERCLAALAAGSGERASILVLLCGEDIPAPEDLPAGVRTVRSPQRAPERARQAALAAVQAEWIVFLDEEDVPERHFLSTLCRAQESSGADVVSCGLHLGEGPQRSVHLFHGEPRALGLVQNGYGTVSLLRCSLLTDLSFPWPPREDGEWPLHARLSAQGATIVSVPEPLLTRNRQPGTIENAPEDALLVVQELERLLPAQLAAAARLAAGLAADSRRPSPPPQGLRRRVIGVVRREGVRGLGRRAAGRLSRGGG